MSECRTFYTLFTMYILCIWQMLFIVYYYFFSAQVCPENQNKTTLALLWHAVPTELVEPQIVHRKGFSFLKCSGFV